MRKLEVLFRILPRNTAQTNVTLMAAPKITRAGWATVASMMYRAVVGRPAPIKIQVTAIMISEIKVLYLEGQNQQKGTKQLMARLPHQS